MFQPTPEAKRLPRRATIVGTIFGIAMAYHAFAITAYNTPKNLLTPVIGAAVDRYVMPYFAQAWSLFAPNPGKADLDYDVRYRYVFHDGSTWLSPLFRGSQIYSPTLAVGPFNPLDELRQVSYACMTLGEDYLVQHNLRTQRPFAIVHLHNVNAAESCLARLALHVQTPRAMIGVRRSISSVAVQLTFVSYETTPVTAYYYHTKKTAKNIVTLYTSPWISDSSTRSNAS